MAASSGGMQLAATAAKRIDDLLTDLNTRIQKLVDVLTGKYYYEIEGSVEVEKEKLTQLRLPTIPQGYIFKARRITVQAPEGTRLQLFSNNESPANFLEVISNVQEYSEGVIGEWQLFGPAVILCAFTKAKVAGGATITVIGELIPREPHPGGHIP